MKKNLISFFSVIAITGLMAARVYGGSITGNTQPENNLSNSDLSIDVSDTIEGITYVPSDVLFHILSDPKIELKFSVGTLSIGGTPENLQLCQGTTLVASYTSGNGEDTIILNTRVGSTQLVNGSSYTLRENNSGNCQLFTVGFLTLDVPSGNTSVQLTINSIDNIGNVIDTASVQLVSIATCGFDLSSTSQTFGSSGGTGSVSVTLSDIACSLSASTNDSWIQVTHILGGGALNGTIGYTVSENTDTISRTGTINISGVTLTVTQERSCTNTLSSSSATVESSGSTDSVSVTAASTECNWTATSSDTWITIDSGSSGTGDGTVNYSVSENTSTSSREGTMTIAGEIFTVTQTGAACTYSISPTSNSVDLSSVTGIVSVTATSGCDWTATSNDTSWLMIDSGSSGAGDGTVDYTVSENTSTITRTGTMTIAGETFTVTQIGVACTYSISPTSNDFELNSGTGSVSVTATSGCDWTASTDETWINITFGSSGSGDGTVDYSVSENTDTSSRTGTMTIAGETFEVTQTASISVTGDPIPDIMANDSEGTLGINEGDQLSITISLDPGDYTGTFADWYMVVSTSSGWQSFNISQMDYSTSGFSSLLQDYGLISFGSAEMFSTPSLSAGTYTYYFAVDLSGQFYYDSVTVTVEAGAVSVPTGFTASASGDTLTLSWNAVSGADGYYLYYGISPGDYMASLDLGNNTAQTYSSIPDGTYYFAVTAYSGTDESGYSNEASVTVNVQ